MILDWFDELNWLAVFAAAAAWFVFSSIWYSLPPLSKAWQRATGVNMEQPGASMVGLFVSTFVLYVIVAAVIAMIARAVGSEDAADGLELGLALGLAFGLATALVTQLYEQKGGSYWLINGINAVISFSIVSIIVTVWT